MALDEPDKDAIGGAAPASNIGTGVQEIFKGDFVVPKHGTILLFSPLQDF